MQNISFTFCRKLYFMLYMYKKESSWKSELIFIELKLAGSLNYLRNFSNIGCF